MVEIWTHLVTQFVMNQTCQYICALFVAYAITIGGVYTLGVMVYRLIRWLLFATKNHILATTWIAA